MSNASNPPALPAELTRPDAQMVVDALNLRLHTTELENATKFLKLATAASRTLSFGEGTLTWTASKSAATKEIEHGLAVTPAVVFLTSTNPAITFGVESKSSSKFKVGGYFEQSVLTGTFAFYWLAIG